MSFLMSCSRTVNESDRLLQTLAELQEQIEARKPHKIAQFLHQDFLAQGRYSLAQLDQMLAFQFQQNRQVYLFLTDTTVQIRDKQADVVTTAYLLGAKNSLPQRGQRYEVKMRWLRVNRQWQLSRINWQRAKTTEH